MKATTPVIGLPARMDPGKDRQYLSRHYADAIQAAGGTPVIIPLLEDPFLKTSSTCSLPVAGRNRVADGRPGQDNA
jgi:gamma-glutamyl-gamma-aminobutyrate hydrolase PuuD